MTTGAWITIVILIAAVVWLAIRQLKLRSYAAECDNRILEDSKQIAKDRQTLTDNQRMIRDLIKKANDADALAKQLNEKYSDIINVESHISQLQATSNEAIRIANEKASEVMMLANQERARAEEYSSQARSHAEAQANTIISEAKQTAKDRLTQSEYRLNSATQEADRIIADAKRRAEEIAGDALQAKEHADHYEQTAKAMKNIIDGYGDQYIVPTYQLLDELADELAHTEPAKKLKDAREHSKMMIKFGRAAACDYVEDIRRTTAIRFVIDAFNGRVDAILSRIKADNHGTLAQKIKDAFNLTNLNGAAFRNARITPEYLQSRLDELRWGTVVMELQDQEREEQRRIKEQIREEERAQREFDKALREAAREEETLKKAMEKIQQQVAQANDEQRAIFEAKLAELEAKLKEAEEKNQRALSMAQQTKTGHVYVISNIGSFGEEVFKIGMTRRLEPNDRIRELGDASVPFEFDIHAMIYSEDAPALEHTLHKRFMDMQVNKVNPRKEFFRVPLTEIYREIESMEISAHWTMTAAARQYRETLAIEEQLRRSPQAQAEWQRHQMELEEQIERSDEAVELAETP